jgi:hypothetical protein
VAKQSFINLTALFQLLTCLIVCPGVLDPAELSCICGSIGDSDRSTKLSNRHILNDAVKNSYSKSQMKSELRSHKGRKLFTTPEPSRRQEKKATEVCWIIFLMFLSSFFFTNLHVVFTIMEIWNQLSILGSLPNITKTPK